MTENILVNGTVILNPQELHNNIQEIIHSKIYKKYIGCSKEFGYITSISKIHHTFQIDVDRNTANVKIFIPFLVERLLPKIGTKIKATVHMIFTHGIFAQIGDSIKILVPTDTIKNGKLVVNNGITTLHITPNHRNTKFPNDSMSDDSSESGSDSDSGSYDSSETGSGSESETGSRSDSESGSYDSSGSGSESESGSYDSSGSESGSESESESESGSYDSSGSDSGSDEMSDTTSNDSELHQSVIQKGDIVTIKITEVKYNKNRYNCIGKLIW
jgi:DNA-directed RNA polymerase subunit E'/Rpb7